MTDLIEAWRDSIFSPRYEVSNLGRIRRDGRVVEPKLNPRTQYLQVSMYAQGCTATKPVHRLVGEAFLGPRPDGLETRHLNGDRFDNRACNLAYGTHSENMLDQVRHGEHAMASRTECAQGHAYDDENTALLSNGHRQCRTCARNWSALSNKRLREARIADGWDPDAYRTRGKSGERKPPPDECSKGHDLSGANLRVVVGPKAGGKWVCRTCERDASDRYQARRRGVLLALPAQRRQERAA